MGKETNALGAKTGEIGVKKRAVWLRTLVYALLGVLALIAGILYCQTLEDWFPNFKVIGYGPYLLSAVFFTFMVHFSSFRRKKVELYEKGFIYEGKTYLWRELERPIWSTRAYPLLGFLPLPFIRVKELKLVPTDPKSPMLSEVLFEDLRDKFDRAWESMK